VVRAVWLDSARRTIYFGGEFDSVGDQDRSNLAAADTGTGLASFWNPRVVGEVDVLTADGRGGIAVGGGFDLGRRGRKNRIGAAVSRRRHRR